MIERARLADERWAKGSSLLRRPGEEEIRRLQGSAARTAASDGSLTDVKSISTEDEGARETMKETTVEGMEEMLKVERDRREKGRPSGPSEEFQPAAWTPRVER